MIDTLANYNKNLLQSAPYSIEVIKDEVCRLVRLGIVSRQQPISALQKYIPYREWNYIERELENNDFLLRDRISDLIAYEKWEND